MKIQRTLYMQSASGMRQDFDHVTGEPVEYYYVYTVHGPTPEKARQNLTKIVQGDKTFYVLKYTPIYKARAKTDTYFFTALGRAELKDRLRKLIQKWKGKTHVKTH